MMKRYGGKLIHSAWDEMGLLEVVDTHGVLSLHFGTYPRQSAMSLTEPDRLELIYARAMLLSLLFANKIHKVLLLGLGGGSLAKFLFQNFLECQIEAIDHRTGVIPIAHHFFKLPQDPRLSIHIEDGNEYICQLANSHPSEFDLIFVDAFDHSGLAESVNQQDFFTACTRLLHPEGILSMNLWGSRRESYRNSIRLFNTYFDGRVLRLPVPNKGNVIGFGLGIDVVRPSSRHLIQCSKASELQFGIEFPRFLQLLSYSNWR